MIKTIKIYESMDGSRFWINAGPSPETYQDHGSILAHIRFRTAQNEVETRQNMCPQARGSSFWV